MLCLSYQIILLYRYENLVNDTDKTMKSISSSIGLNFNLPNPDEWKDTIDFTDDKGDYKFPDDWL